VTKGTPRKPATNIESAPAISAIGVEGYKSLRRRTEVAIRPLTLLAGANSSGKSSVMQGPLLLKQTLDATYDPGALLLDGPHVRFTAADQLLTRGRGTVLAKTFSVVVRFSDGGMVDVCFDKKRDGGFDVAAMVAARSHLPPIKLRRGMSLSELSSFWPILLKTKPPVDSTGIPHLPADKAVFRDRCFLRAITAWRSEGELLIGRLDVLPDASPYLRAIVHVPALRGNPERTYKTSAVGHEFPGTFEPYVASIISAWQLSRDVRLKQLGKALEKLGLTWKVEATRLNDTQVELRVGRLRKAAKGGEKDLVSIADVGFGLSQTLPVVVALLAARPGQLVYLEEPEIHLHPKAQVALAQILTDAATRGVRVVAETHSALLLLGVQTLVAEGKLSPDLVALHWFSQAADGTTEVRSAEIDRAGAFGDWPEDFGEVALDAQSRYLDAAEARLAGR
jgi:predicted ATPase